MRGQNSAPPYALQSIVAGKICRFFFNYFATLMNQLFFDFCVKKFKRFQM